MSCCMRVTNHYLACPIIIVQESALAVQHGLTKRQPRMQHTLKRNVRMRYGLPSTCDIFQNRVDKTLLRRVFATARPALASALRDTAVLPAKEVWTQSSVATLHNCKRADSLAWRFFSYDFAFRFVFNLFIGICMCTCFHCWPIQLAVIVPGMGIVKPSAHWLKITLASRTFDIWTFTDECTIADSNFIDISVCSYTVTAIGMLMSSKRAIAMMPTLATTARRVRCYWIVLMLNHLLRDFNKL